MILIANLIVTLSLSFILSGVGAGLIKKLRDKMPYTFPSWDDYKVSEFYGFSFASYIVVFNLLVPLDLVVVLEIAKMSYSKVIEDDMEMAGINYQDH